MKRRGQEQGLLGEQVWLEMGWPCYLVSLSLSFLIWKVGITQANPFL